MKNSIFTTLMSCALFLLISCSNDDEIVTEQNKEKTTLSFATVLNDLIPGREADKQQLGNIPQCSEDAPAFVEVVVTHNGEPLAGTFQQPLRLTVYQDSQGNYFTGESAELELVPGIYSLEYFRVLDKNLQVIWIAPREEAGEVNFAGMVDSPLPLEIDLRAGTKKYVDVDVICYDDRLVNYYGYLFFHLQTNQAIKFCIFGNYCDETGRHIDAVSYSVSVWNFSGDDAAPKGTILYEDLQNGVWISDDFENGISETGTSPVCIALPDTEGQDQYYFEISILDGLGSSATSSLIRRGVITDEDVRSLYDGENRVDYYHFQEGNCNFGDSPDLFEKVTGEPTVVEGFLAPLESYYTPEGSYEWIHEYNEGGVLLKSFMYERFPYRLISEFNYSDHWGVGYPFFIKQTNYFQGNGTTTTSELSYSNDKINMILTRDASGNFLSKVFLVEYDAAHRVTEIHSKSETDMFLNRTIRQYDSQGRLEISTTYFSETQSGLFRREINTYTSFGEIHISKREVAGFARELEYFYREDNTLKEIKTVSFHPDPDHIRITRFDENEVLTTEIVLQGNIRTETSYFEDGAPNIANYYRENFLYMTINFKEDGTSTSKIIEEDSSFRIEYKDASGNIYKTEYYNAAGELIYET